MTVNNVYTELMIVFQGNELQECGLSVVAGSQHLTNPNESYIVLSDGSNLFRIGIQKVEL